METGSNTGTQKIAVYRQMKKAAKAKSHITIRETKKKDSEEEEEEEEDNAIETHSLPTQVVCDHMSPLDQFVIQISDSARQSNPLHEMLKLP